MISTSHSCEIYKNRKLPCKAFFFFFEIICGVLDAFVVVAACIRSSLMILKLMSGDFIVVRSCLPLHLIWSNVPFCNYCFESSWAFKVWSFNKIPRPVPSQIRYITDQVTRSQRWWNKDGAGRWNMRWCYGCGCRCCRPGWFVAAAGLLFPVFPVWKEDGLGVAVPGKQESDPSPSKAGNMLNTKKKQI